MKTYQYTECGLETVFLSNGVEVVRSARGDGIRIGGVDRLHEEIGLAVSGVRRSLCGPEIRFLRKELLLSQKALGELLGVTELTVARWEKDQTPMPRATDALLRTMYLDLGPRSHVPVMTLLERISEDDAADGRRIVLHRSDRGRWALVDGRASGRSGR